jgi:hypothetical protein
MYSDARSNMKSVYIGLRPAVYFRPQKVWEIRGAE